MANPIKFGLSNTHYALIKDDGTYETPKPVKGSVSLNLTPEGDSSSFAADNDANYYFANGNAGYSGTLEIAFAEDDFLADTLGRIKDSNGMLLEAADAQAAPFALLYEISSNVLPQRYVLYSCTLNRPEQEANTTSDTVDPDTVSLDFRAISKEFTYGTEKKPFVLGSLTKSTTTETAYAAFFDEVLAPTKASA